MTNHAISIDGLLQASEGLRRLVRKDEVEARRQQAIEAEHELARQREEERGEQRRAPKSPSAPAVVSGTTALIEGSGADGLGISEPAESLSRSIVGGDG